MQVAAAALALAFKSADNRTPKPINPTLPSRAREHMFPGATILAPLMMRKFKIGQPLLQPIG